MSRTSAHIKSELRKNGKSDEARQIDRYLHHTDHERIGHRRSTAAAFAQDVGEKAAAADADLPF